MNAERMCAISNDLMSVINEDEKTRDYRIMTDIDYSMYNTPLYNIQKMFMLCLLEMPESKNIQLYLQDFFIDEETEDIEQLQRLLKQNKTNIKSLYIDTSFTSSSLHEIIDLFSLTDLSHIQKLYYCGDRSKEVEINRINPSHKPNLSHMRLMALNEFGDKRKEAEINRILFPSLQNVALFHVNWTNNEKNLSENIAQCRNLQYLCIDNFRLSHKILESFFKFISSQISMKELTLKRLDCKEHGGHNCKRLSLDLSQHSTLSKLDLRGLPGRLRLDITTPSLVNVTLLFIHLDESSQLLSRDMLKIERMRLTCIEMSAEILQNIFAVLENLPQSVDVKMHAIKPETEYKRVRVNIWSSQTFHVIRDNNDRFIVFETRKPSKE
jgi:hypothetical protein